MIVSAIVVIGGNIHFYLMIIEENSKKLVKFAEKETYQPPADTERSMNRSPYLFRLRIINNNVLDLATFLIMLSFTHFYAAVKTTEEIIP